MYNPLSSFNLGIMFNMDCPLSYTVLVCPDLVMFKHVDYWSHNVMTKGYLNLLLVSYLRGYVYHFRYRWYRTREVENRSELILGSVGKACR